MSPMVSSVQTVRRDQDFPSWTTTFVGSDGCASNTVYYSVPVNGFDPPAGVPKYIEEAVSFTSKSPHNYAGKVKGIPPYRFTPYAIRTVTRKDFAVKRRVASTGSRVVWWQTGYVSKVSGSCTNVVANKWSQQQFTIYDNITTYADYPQTPYTINGFEDSDISDAKAKMEDELAQAALTSYDVLTELAEMREVPRMVCSITNDIRNIIGALHGRFGKNLMKEFAHLTPRQLLNDTSRIAKLFGEQWMQYRYGIMPLVYSYRDIQKTLKRHQQVRERVSTTVSPRDLNVTLPGPTSTYVVIEYQGAVTIRGCVFEDFLQDEISRLSGLGFNPIVTAWELIPYSFVVDWFVNVGDYIARKTSMSFASKTWACISRRDNYTKVTSIHLPASTQSVTVGNKIPTNWHGAAPPSNPPLVIENIEGRFPLRMEITDGYSRQPVDIRNAHLRLNPSLNWRRLCDSGVMAVNLLRDFMSRIRR